MVFCSFTGTKSKLISNRIKYFTLDKLNQVYTIQKDNSLQKFSADGNLLISKNLKTEGEINYIDAKNVFDIILFYKNMNTLVTTDNLFTQRHTLNFNELGAQISAVARSFDNHIWGYDILSQRLVKTDILGNKIITSSALSSQSNSYKFYQIIEAVPYVFLIDSSAIVTLNIYGKVIHEKKLNQKINHSFLYQDTLWLQDHKTLSFLPIRNPLDSIATFNASYNYGTVHRLNNGALHLKSDSLFLQTY